MSVTQDSHALFAAARQNSPNPFSLEHVISANEVWGDVMADLTDLNQHIDQKINQAITEVRQKFSRKIGITMKGDRGTGKSHVIHRIWKNIEREGDAFFAYLPPCKNPSRIDSHVRVNLCTDFARQNARGITQWQKFAVAIISTLKGTEFESEYQQYIDQCDEPDYLKKFILENVGKSNLESFFDNLTEAILENQPELDFNFLKAVLFTLFKNSKLAQVGLAWLKGDDHPSIKQAGLPEYTSEQQDDRAVWVIEQICKLGEVVAKPVVICFDQVDCYEANTETGDSKAQVVAKCIDRIYFQCSNVILLCCVIPDTAREISQMQSGIPDRVGQWTVSAKPPTADQMVELVKLRLAWFYRHHNLNQDNYPNLYPFDENELRQVANEAAAARQLFKEWCAKRFAEVEIGNHNIREPIKTKKQELLDIYNELLTKDDALSKKDDSLNKEDELASVITSTIKMLPDRVVEGIKIEKIEKINASSAHDLHLIISGYDPNHAKKVRIGVRICETKTGLTFNAVMKRLLNYKKHKLTRGCLVRSTPIPLNWRKGKELEQQLREKQNGEVVVLKKDEIKPLVAIETIYRQSADYGFAQDELIELIKELELVAENPLIREILSAPAIA
ncbi:MAG: hypothetical protein KME16_10995 [Scytolyngbya sp. HA4215-MV1]|jgi:hypothetical protein|nr:hypothetical protein [Scytolyngbya sp. HA4215-MV1]